jgi:hypothetical protein
MKTLILKQLIDDLTKDDIFEIVKLEEENEGSIHEGEIKYKIKIELIPGKNTSKLFS